MLLSATRPPACRVKNCRWITHFFLLLPFFLLGTDGAAAEQTLEQCRDRQNDRFEELRRAAEVEEGPAGILFKVINPGDGEALAGGFPTFIPGDYLYAEVDYLYLDGDRFRRHHSRNYGNEKVESVIEGNFVRRGSWPAKHFALQQIAPNGLVEVYEPPWQGEFTDNSSWLTNRKACSVVVTRVQAGPELIRLSYERKKAVERQETLAKQAEGVAWFRRMKRQPGVQVDDAGIAYKIIKKSETRNPLPGGIQHIVTGDFVSARIKHEHSDSSIPGKDWEKRDYHNVNDPKFKVDPATDRLIKRWYTNGVFDVALHKIGLGDVVEIYLPPVDPDSRTFHDEIERKKFNSGTQFTVEALSFDRSYSSERRKEKPEIVAKPVSKQKHMTPKEFRAQAPTKTIDNGMAYRVIAQGHGKPASLLTPVRYRAEVNYLVGGELWLTDGLGQDLPVKTAATPAEIPNRRYIVRGIAHTLSMMREGDTWKVLLPPHLAFGFDENVVEINTGETVTGRPENAHILMELSVVEVLPYDKGESLDVNDHLTIDTGGQDCDYGFSRYLDGGAKMASRLVLNTHIDDGFRANDGAANDWPYWPTITLENPKAIHDWADDNCTYGRDELAGREFRPESVHIAIWDDGELVGSFPVPRDREARTVKIRNAGISELRLYDRAGAAPTALEQERTVMRYIGDLSSVFTYTEAATSHLKTFGTDAGYVISGADYLCERGDTAEYRCVFHAVGQEYPRDVTPGLDRSGVIGAVLTFYREGGQWGIRELDAIDPAAYKAAEWSVISKMLERLKNGFDTMNDVLFDNLK